MVILECFINSYWKYFPPIPSEVILPFSGFMTTVTTMNIFGVVTSATFGSVMGAVILYELGRVLNVDRIKKLLRVGDIF